MSCESPVITCRRRRTSSGGSVTELSVLTEEPPSPFLPRLYQQHKESEHYDLTISPEDAFAPKKSPSSDESGNDADEEWSSKSSTHPKGPAADSYQEKDVESKYDKKMNKDDQSNRSLAKKIPPLDHVLLRLKSDLDELLITMESDIDSSSPSPVISLTSPTEATSMSSSSCTHSSMSSGDKIKNTAVPDILPSLPPVTASSSFSSHQSPFQDPEEESQYQILMDLKKQKSLLEDTLSVLEQQYRQEETRETGNEEQQQDCLGSSTELAGDHVQNPTEIPMHRLLKPLSEEKRETMPSIEELRRQNEQRDATAALLDEIPGVRIVSLQEERENGEPSEGSTMGATWVYVTLDLMAIQELRIVYLRTSQGEMQLQSAYFVEPQANASSKQRRDPEYDISKQLHLPNLDDLLEFAKTQPYCHAFRMIVEHTCGRLELWKDRRDALSSLLRAAQVYDEPLCFGLEVCRNALDPDDDLFQRVDCHFEIPIASFSEPNATESDPSCNSVTMETTTNDMSKVSCAAPVTCLQFTAVLRLTPNCPKILGSVFLESLNCSSKWHYAYSARMVSDAASFVQRQQISLCSPVQVLHQLKLSLTQSLQHQELERRRQDVLQQPGAAGLEQNSPHDIVWVSS